ncbi:MAG: hypothetical protein KDA42_10285 [Planctomycetales bacterium]|nr:hypothetical protein [Planctomycetales bacterium]
MVNQTAHSLLAQYADDAYEFETESIRTLSPKREQSSRARYATQARYSRRKSNVAGPKRRLRK